MIIEIIELKFWIRFTMSVEYKIKPKSKLKWTYKPKMPPNIPFPTTQTYHNSQSNYPIFDDITSLTIYHQKLKKLRF